MGYTIMSTLVQTEIQAGPHHITLTMTAMDAKTATKTSMTIAMAYSMHSTVAQLVVLVGHQQTQLIMTPTVAVILAKILTMTTTVFPMGMIRVRRVNLDGFLPILLMRMETVAVILLKIPMAVERAVTKPRHVEVMSIIPPCMHTLLTWSWKINRS